MISWDWCSAVVVHVPSPSTLASSLRSTNDCWYLVRWRWAIVANGRAPACRAACPMDSQVVEQCESFDCYSSQASWRRANSRPDSIDCIDRCSMPACKRLVAMLRTDRKPNSCHIVSRVELNCCWSRSSTTNRLSLMAMGFSMTLEFCSSMSHMRSRTMALSSLACWLDYKRNDKLLLGLFDMKIKLTCSNCSNPYRTNLILE